MTCPAGAITWIYLVFHDCIVSRRDHVSFAIGLFSNIVFLVSSIPQIVLTFRTRCVEGQSPWFFSLLFLGSTCSLLGAIITNGLVTQIIQSVFYVLMDGILLFQLICFRYVIKKGPSSESVSSRSGTGRVCGCGSSCDSEEDVLESIPAKEDSLCVPPAVVSVAVMSGFVEAKTDFAGPYTGSKLVGTVFAWVSTVIFITSRVPQLAKNFSEKSFGDISVVWLIFSIVGNLSYFVSILVRDVSGTYLWRQTPFIVGAVGPAVLDIFLLLQMLIYRTSSGETEKESIHEEEKKA